MVKDFKKDLFWLSALILVGLGARLWLIQTFATPLPFWDQWEDTRTVFSPYFQGKLTWTEMFSPHNENRIFIPRLYNLALLLLNGQWDNLVQMVANVFFYVATLAGFSWLLSRVLGRRFWPLIAGMFMVVLAMPFAWENTLAGYHSQFYLMMFFSLLTFWLLGFHKAGSLKWCCGVLTAVCCLFTLAAGLLAPAAVVGLIVVRHFVAETNRTPGALISALKPSLPTLVVCLAVVGLGLAIKVEVPFHQVLKAHSLLQFLVFLGKYLAWPWIVLPPFAIFNLFPLTLLAWLYWRTPEARTNAEELVLLLGLWSILQGLASAYARGSYQYPQWRYMDCNCFVMVANVLSLALLGTNHVERLPFRRYFRPAAGLWVLASVSGLVLLCGRAWQVDIPQRVTFHRQQLLTTRAYLATGERKYLETPVKEYLSRFAAPNERQDHPQALIDMLNQPHIRELMPACARDPLTMAPADVSGFVTNADIPAKPTVPGEVSWSSLAADGPKATGKFESLPISRPKLPFLEFRVAGDLGQPGLSLRMLHSGKTTELKPRKAPDGEWQSYQVRAPAEEFKIVAQDDSASGWFAFQPPREVGWLSYLSARLMEAGMWLFFTGVAVYAVTFAGRRSK